jgi:hypothetical protein
VVVAEGEKRTFDSITDPLALPWRNHYRSEVTTVWLAPLGVSFQRIHPSPFDLLKLLTFKLQL